MGSDRKPTTEKSKRDTLVFEAADPPQSRLVPLLPIVLQLLAISLLVMLITAVIEFGDIDPAFQTLENIHELLVTTVISSLVLTVIALAMKRRINRKQPVYQPDYQQSYFNQQGSMLRQQQLGYVMEEDRELRHIADWPDDEQVHTLGELVNYPVDDPDDD